MSCLIWTRGKTGSGYGVCYPNGAKKQMLIHRYIYELTHGEIPKGQVIMHICDNKLCYNIDHLRAGTQKENIRDMFNKKRQHDRRGDNGNHSKLSTEQVIRIKSELKSGVKMKQIAKNYNVSYAAIVDINLGRTWKHIVGG